MSDWIAQIELWIEGLAGSFWVYPALTGFATIDGFFPPIPSESVIIALATLSQTSPGTINLLWVIVAGAVGAFVGDQIAYTIGSKLNVRELRIFRGPKAQKSLDWAETALDNRGASFIIAARYIPIGRVAVNMTAGAVAFRRRRFVLLTAIAALTWAIYSTLIGLSAGALFAGQPLLGIIVGVIGGVLMGILVDKLLSWWGNRSADAAAEVPATPDQTPGTPGTETP